MHSQPTEHFQIPFALIHKSQRSEPIPTAITRAVKVILYNMQRQPFRDNPTQGISPGVVPHLSTLSANNSTIYTWQSFIWCGRKVSCKKNGFLKVADEEPRWMSVELIFQLSSNPQLTFLWGRFGLFIFALQFYFV